MRLLRSLLPLVLVVAAGTVQATPQNLFQRAGFDQNLGAQLPLEASLRDSGAGGITLAVLGGLLLVSWRRERQREREDRP